mgnify:CR=1 FL=1|tara:strand:- start:711 stop:947 length:237 start_codon:yes stop_codon:yes gene_type:complete
MKNKKLKEKYCYEFGYPSFNKWNENDYSKWLECELLKALKQVKNNVVLDDVIKCEHENTVSGHSPFVACVCNDCGEEI